jgi:glutamate racemase
VGKDIATLPLAGLAGAIEFGRTQEAEEIIAKAFQGVPTDTYKVLVLACTHYPLIVDAFRKVAGDVPIFDPASAVAARVKSHLWPREVGEGKLRVILSDDNPAFRTHFSALGLDRDATIEVIQ